METSSKETEQISKYVLQQNLNDSMTDRIACIEREEGKSSSVASSADKTNSLDQDIAWYPQSKINIVKRKLNKGNPASKLP